MALPSRILITGAAGQLGSDLARRLPNAVAMSRAQLSITDRAAVLSALRATSARLVFNCAAYNAVDQAESRPELAAETNATGPGVLAAACRELGAQLVHFSTNFVFSGEAISPYAENDRAEPASVYGRTKRQGEINVLEALPGAIVIRSAGLFGSAGSAVKGGSFPQRIIARARAGDELRVVDDQRLNPTSTADLADAAIGIAAGGETGLFHLVAAGCCTFHEFATEVLRLAAVDRPVAAITTAELGAAAARPRNGCLRSDRVRALRPWREALAAHLAGD